jgi:hypothetical protein
MRDRLVPIRGRKEGKKRKGSRKGREPGMVAHACNPSYSGGRDQEGGGRKLVWGNSSPDPVSKRKKSSPKEAWWSGSRYGP